MSKDILSTDTFIEAIKELSDATIGIVALAERIKRSGDIVATGQFYQMVAEQHKNIEDITDIIGSLKTEFSRDICPFLFDSNNIPKISIKDRTLTRGTRLHASIPQHKLVKGLAWVRKEGYQELIKETVHPKSLTSAVKAYIQDKGMFPPEDAVSVFIEDVISIRKG